MSVTIYSNSGGGYTASIWMENQYTGQSIPVGVYTPVFNGGTAEVVAERPQVNNAYTDLSNFGTLTVRGAYANGMGLAHAFGNYANKDIQMYDYAYYPIGRHMAGPTPNSLFNSGQSFYDYQHLCY